MRRSLIKIEHLKRRDEISRLFKYGKKYCSTAITIRYIENSQLNNRFLFIPQKNFGLAVSRNLIRRRLNEICRVNQYRFFEHYDVALLVRKDVLALTYSQLESSVIGLLSRIGLIDNKI